MSNKPSRFPALSLPIRASEVPLPPLPAPAPALSQFPTPWCVGPYGDIWVAADVELVDGKWRETCSNPRLVVAQENGWDDGVAEMIVKAVNAHSK